MTDYNLRFPDEATTYELIGSTLSSSREDEDGRIFLACFTEDYVMDLIGIIYNNAIVDSDGVVITQPKAINGWHVNLRLLNDQELPYELATFVINPKTPYRTWA